MAGHSCSRKSGRTLRRSPAARIFSAEGVQDGKQVEDPNGPVAPTGREVVVLERADAKVAIKAVQNTEDVIDTPGTIMVNVAVEDGRANAHYVAMVPGAEVSISRAL